MRLFSGTVVLLAIDDGWTLICVKGLLERISELTKQDHTLQFTSLAHLLTVERLGEAYQRMFSTQVFIEITKDEADKFDK